jgi:hypothetical protein
MDDAASAVTGLGYALEDGLVNAAKNGKAAFGDMAQFILAEIQRILIRSLILRPLFGAIGGFIGDNPVGNAFSGSFGGGKAGGGMVSAGKTYMVGERGPEMVTMGGNGFVTPNHKMGGGNTFNVDMRGASVEAVARLERFVEATLSTWICVGHQLRLLPDWNGLLPHWTELSIKGQSQQLTATSNAHLQHLHDNGHHCITILLGRSKGHPQIQVFYRHEHCPTNWVAAGVQLCGQVESCGYSDPCTE